MPKSKDPAPSSSSGGDSDGEVNQKLKRKKQVTPEKPMKKQNSGETSRAVSSPEQSSTIDTNMLQKGILEETPPPSRETHGGLIPGP
uniref:Uncharacterized protein n=1 Tax=Ursus americanus TaxID=9643 RepID=A0A452RNW6_URSAM